MFLVIIHMYMADTVRVTTDDPASVIATLNLRRVSGIHISNNMGD